MKNIVTTIPKSRFKTWALAERILLRCDGESDHGKAGRNWLWFIRTASIPKQELFGSVCFMVYDGLIRGYLQCIETAPSEKYAELGYILKNRPSQGVIVLANWTPLPASEQVPMTGFQGWRYSALRP